jgi:hypothetical protein
VKRLLRGYGVESWCFAERPDLFAVKGESAQNVERVRSQSYQLESILDMDRF